MALVSPPEKVDLREVLIILFHTYLRFRAWLLLYLIISKMFSLSKCELAKAWLVKSKNDLKSYEIKNNGENIIGFYIFIYLHIYIFIYIFLI